MQQFVKQIAYLPIGLKEIIQPELVKNCIYFFLHAADLISKNPQIGHTTNRTDTRIKVVKDYLIIYKVAAKTIIILSIIDGRRNPDHITKRT